MQNLENQNNASAVDAAAGKQGDAVTPDNAPAATSVESSSAPPTGNQRSHEPETPSTHVPHDSTQPVATAKVHGVPEDIASARLKSEAGEAPKGAPLPTAESKPNPSMAPQHEAAATGTTASGPAAAAEHSASADYTSASSPIITIDDFAKVDLRVAQVLVAERIPKADKLLRLEVDLGYEKRQILAGIAMYYEPEKLVGRKIVIVANLAPRKMRGLESNGMLLAASLPPDGSPVLAGFLEDVPLGARLK
jgi:methionyl-tRNA synthetase